MSEQFIANAQIVVTANTAPFRAELEKEVQRAQKIPVNLKVVPDTRGFAAEVRRRLARLKIAPVSIRVKPVPTGFRAELQELVTKSSGGVTAHVLVAPDMTGFRTALASEVAAAAGGVVAPVVPVAATAAAPGRPAVAPAAVAAKAEAAAVTQATAAVTKKTAADLQGTKAEIAYAAAVRADELAHEDLTATLGATEGLKAQEVRLNEALKASSAAVRAAYREENAALIANSESLKANIGARQAANRIRSETTRAFEAREAELLAQRNAAFAAAEQHRVRVTRQAEKERLAALAQGSKEARAFFAAEQRQVAAAQAQTRKAASRLEGAETFVGRGRRESAQLAQEAARATKAAEAALAAHRAALETNNIALQKHTLALLRDAKAFETQKLAALDAAVGHDALNAATLRSQARQEQLRRGFFATSLAALGARGATLAASQSFLIGAAGAVTLFKSLQTAAEFETSLNVFRVNAEATAEEMKEISLLSRQLGVDLTLPGVTATTAAEAMSGLAKAGLSVEDAMAGARGTLQLSTAATIETAEAVELVASALNAFALSGEEASRVADLFAASARASQGSISDVGIALQQSAAAAAQAGISLEDTVALLTLLARGGIQGSDAGTSLRTAIIRLINPTNKAKEAIKALGIDIRDVSGNVRPEVFADFNTQLEKLSTAQRDATLAMIFGQDAFRSAAILGRAGSRGLNETRETTQEVGAAAEQAAAKTSGLAGAWENAKNQAKELGLNIGQALAPAAKDALEVFAGGVENINRFAEVVRRSGDDSEDAAAKYAKLVIEAGKINYAVAVRGEKAGERLLKTQEELNQALTDSAPAALKAAGAIEDYRAALGNAAQAAEGLNNRIDESFDRFAKPLPTPTLPKGPVPIGPEAKLEGRAAIASAQGDLRELERIQEIQLANAKKAYQNSKGNIQQRTDLFNKMNAAEANLISTRQQIVSERTSDQKKAAEETKRTIAEADRDFLAALGGAEQNQRNRIEIASQTEILNDDIAQTKRLRAVLLKQREAIFARVRDADTKREALREVNQKLFEIDQDISRLVSERAEQRFEARVSFAEATGNMQLLIKLIDQQIKDTKTAIDKARKAGQDLTTLNTALADLEERRRSAQDQAVDRRVTRAQLRLELGVGSEQEVLAALNERIAIKRAQLARAKRDRVATAEIYNELLQAQVDRKNFLNEAKDEAQKGTTAFDLLQQFSEQFNQTAGNLIGTNQPFAGPTGFTADIAQFLRRNQSAGRGFSTPSPNAPVSDSISRNDAAHFRDLIAALDRNTDAISGRRGNTSTVTSGAIARNDEAHFGNATQSRRQRESRSGI